jgi:hypothetical protein
MAILTEADMLEYMPDMNNYGIQDFTDMISKAEDDIIRLLRIEWWPQIPGRTNFGDVMDPSKLKDSQLTRSAAYYCLYKYVLPKLTQWAVEGDSFQTQINFYKMAFDEEFDLAKRELFYDWDGDGQYEDNERNIQPRQRLVR